MTQWAGLNNTTPEPTPPANPSGGGNKWAGLSNSPKTAVTPSVTAPAAPVATPSPFWATSTPDFSFGPSPTLDPSGKPLLDYRKKGDTATTTDKTRVDTTFDPTVAAPHPQSDIATPRVVPDALKTAIKQQAGAPASDVIDHKMALTVAGSNMPENLRAENKDANAKQGTFEASLDEQVRNGKISLFDSQKLEAANKGLPEPFTGGQPQAYWDKVASYLKSKTTPLTTSALPGVVPPPSGSSSVTPSSKTAWAGLTSKPVSLPGVNTPFDANQQEQFGTITVPEGKKPGDTFVANGRTYTVNAPSTTDIADSLYKGMNPEQKPLTATLVPGKTDSSTPQVGTGQTMAQGFKSAYSDTKEALKSGYDSLGQATMEMVDHPGQTAKFAGKAVVEEGRSAGEGLFNFFNDLGTAMMQPKTLFGAKPTVGMHLSHDVAPGYEGANLAGNIIGTTATFMIGGETLKPITAALEKSSPLMKIVGKVVLNTSLPALIQQVGPLKEGETQLSRFLNNSLGNIAFGLTGIIPNRSISAFATGLSQFGIGAIKGQDPSANALNSVVLTIMGFAGPGYDSKTKIDIVGMKQKAEAISNMDLGKNPNAQDWMAKEMAKEFLKSSPEDQMTFAKQVQALYNKVVENYQATPNKQGGFARNPFAEGDAAPKPTLSINGKDMTVDDIHQMPAEEYKTLSPEDQKAIAKFDDLHSRPAAEDISAAPRETQIKTLTDNPEQVKLYRGEGASSEGHAYYTTDPAFAKGFGGANGKVLEGTLPAGSKILDTTSDIANLEPEILSAENAGKAAMNKGGDQAAFDQAFYQSFFDDGYDAVISTGNRGETQVVVNPKHYDLFKAPGAQTNSAKLPTFQGFPDLSTTVLEKLQGRNSVSKQFISDLTNSPELKEAERNAVRTVLAQYPDNKDVPVQEFADQVKEHLLPLDREKVVTGARYENIALPADQRGPIDNYSEHIYTSPVETSAGDIHFGGSEVSLGEKTGKDTRNYFGHTRVEDLPDSTTRRVIEVQSDLYQKGRLEKEAEIRPAEFTSGRKGYVREGNPTPERLADIAKLQQYNDPTAHFRMVREEIKQAAIDGKTKLQFPTGETAMKIEQLSRADAFRGMDESGAMHDPITQQGLRVGRLVGDVSGKPWIITDVLKNGEFKAVPKSVYERAIPSAFDGKPMIQESSKETFDISGKVDTNNPIYRFYEKTLGRYLASKYGAKIVTDKQGVSWYELNVPKEAATKPVIAHKTYKPLFGGPKAPTGEIAKLIQSKLPEGTILPLIFDPKLLQKSGDVGQFREWEDVLTNEAKKAIALYTKRGKASVRTAFHETLHALEAMMPKEMLAEINKETLAIMTPADHRYYSDSKYDTPEKRAAEFRADEQGKKWADEAGYKSRIQKILDRIKAFVQKIIETAKAIYQKFYSDIPNKQGGFADFMAPRKKPELDIQAKDSTSDIENRLTELQIERDNLAESIKGNKATELLKFRGKNGLGEVTGKQGGIWQSMGDEKASQAGFPSTENARAAVHDLELTKARIAGMDAEIKALKAKVKDENLQNKVGEARYNDIANKKYIDDYKSEQAKTWEKILKNPELPVEEKDTARSEYLYDKFIAPQIKEALSSISEKDLPLDLKSFLEANPGIMGAHPSTDQIEADTVEEWMKNTKEETENDKHVSALVDAQSAQKKLDVIDKVIADFKEETGIDLSPDITANNKGVVPPSVRGDLRAPELDWTKIKRRAMIKFSRETIERNIENITEDKATARKLNDFYIEKIRSNTADQTRYLNAKRTKVRAEAKRLGLVQGSKADKAVVNFREGKISPEEYKKIAGNKKDAYEQMAAFIQKEYAHDMYATWNPKREEYGYKPVPEKQNYFRHGKALTNQWFGAAGVLRDLIVEPSELPGEIAGLTENFKPGKQFASPELQRTGIGNSLGLLEGYDKYLDAFSAQAFHIDSIQRGRAIEKYARQASRSARLSGQPLDLNNFIANITEHVNLVAGKTSVIDRAIEGMVGRKMIRAIDKLSNIESANIIAGNLASAFTHTIPIVLNIATVDKSSFILGMLDSLRTPFIVDKMKIGGISSDFLTRRYPVEYIQPTLFKKAGNVLGFPFHAADLFISHVAVRSKFYEGLKRGLSPEEAMKRADNYATRVIGDRSRGNLPTLMGAKTLKWLTRFQIEVNDNLSVLIHDIPRWSSESIKDGKQNTTDFVKTTDKKTGKETWMKKEDIKNYYKMATALVSFVVAIHLFNWLMKKVKGTGKGFDPISIGLGLAGFNDDDIPFIPQSSGQDLSTRIGAGISEVSGELPFSSFVAPFFGGQGQYPVIDTIPNPIAWLSGKSSLGTELLKPAVGLSSPIGGGVQVQKTIKGITDVHQGAKMSASGKTVQQTIDQTPLNYIKAGLFGTSSVAPYTPGTKKSAGEIEYERIKGSSNPVAEWDKLNSTNHDLAQKVKTIADIAKLDRTSDEVSLMLLGVKDGTRAKAIYKNMQGLKTNAEKAALWDRLVSKKVITKIVGEQLDALFKSTP